MKRSEASSHISKTPDLLEYISNYKGCENFIRDALSNPGNVEMEDTAFDAVSDVVEVLEKFYAFSLQIEVMWPNMVTAICTESPLEAIGNQPAIIKQVAELFKFVFLFDNEKIMHPSIQNDFAYYRRVFHRMKNRKTKKNKKKKGDEELANKMSFFFAYPTPLMKVLIDSTSKMKENPFLVSGLSTLADACTKTLIDLLAMDNFKEDIDNGFDHNAMLLLCTMTGCIILVDHFEPNGVFHSKSTVQIRHAVDTLVTYSTEYIAKAFLINSLRFTTLHLNDEQTIGPVKRALNPQ